MNKQYMHTFFLYGLLFLIICGFSTKVIAQAPEISPQLIKVSKKRISRTVYEFTFKATLINHDIPIKNVTASIISSSPQTVIMSDNTVTFNDVAANETVTSVDAFTLRQDRKFPYNPDDIHWDISYESMNQDVIIDLRFLPEDIEMIENKTKSILMGLNIISELGDTPFSVKISQTIEPAVNGVLSPNLDGNTLTFTGSDFKKIDQTLPLLPPGEYQLITNAHVLETGYSVTTTTSIKVKPENVPQLSFGSPVMGGRAIPVDTINNLSPHISIAGKDMETVTEVKIRSLNSQHNLLLSRTGVQTYEGTLTLDAYGMQSGECLNFVADPLCQNSCRP